MKKIIVLFLLALVLFVATACVDYGDPGQSADVHVHNYTLSAKAATCTEGGYDVYSCSCGESYGQQVTDPLGHAWNGWRVTELPTTTTQGMKERTCSACGHHQIDPVVLLNEDSGIVVVFWTEALTLEETASITILGKAWMEYSLVIYDPAGVPLSLANATAYADGEGYLTWEFSHGWIPGTYEMVISGGGKTVTVNFHVFENEE